MKSALAALALFTIGCATTNEAQPQPDPLAGCSAERLSALVGRAYSEALRAQAQRTSGARAVRVIRPGDMVTMDYRSDRLNIHLGERDRIDRFDCG